MVVAYHDQVSASWTGVLGARICRLTVAAITLCMMMSRHIIHGRKSGDESPHYHRHYECPTIDDRLLILETLPRRPSRRVLTADKQIILVPVALRVSTLETTTLPTIDPTEIAHITQYLSLVLIEALSILPSFLMIHGACLS